MPTKMVNLSLERAENMQEDGNSIFRTNFLMLPWEHKNLMFNFLVNFPNHRLKMP